MACYLLWWHTGTFFMQDVGETVLTNTILLSTEPVLLDTFWTASLKPD